MKSQPCPLFVADRHSAYSPTCLRLDSSLSRPVGPSWGKEDVHVWFAFVDDMVQMRGRYEVSRSKTER